MRDRWYGDESSPEGERSVDVPDEINAGSYAERDDASWPMRHQGLTVFFGMLALVIVSAGLFALAAFGILRTTDARIQAQEDAPGELGPIDNAELPYLDMRVKSFSLEDYPIISTDLAVSAPAGGTLPALSKSDFAIVEADGGVAGSSDDAADSPVDALAFVFDSVGGTCHVLYKTEQAAAGSSHRLAVSLKPDSGFRGGIEMTYTAPDLEQAAKREAEAKKARGWTRGY